MAGLVLKPGGCAPIKVPQGAGFQEFVAAAQRRSRAGRFIMAWAHWVRRVEIYMLASGLDLV
jgi:hypothetical protein